MTMQTFAAARPCLAVFAAGVILVAASIATIWEEDMVVDDLHTIGVLSTAEGLVPKLSTNQAPAYFIVARAWWLLTDESLWWLRVLSVAMMTATVPVVYLIGRTVRSDAAGIFAAFIFAVQPIVITHAYNVRPYALLTLSAGLALLFVALDLKDRVGSGERVLPKLRPPLAHWRTLGIWAGITVATFVVVATHHVGALFPIVLSGIYAAAWLCCRAHRAGIALSMLYLCVASAAIAAVYAPYIYGNFVQDVASGFWNGDGSLGRALDVMREMYSGGRLMAYAFAWAVLAVFAIAYLVRSKSYHWLVFLVVGWLGAAPLLQLATVVIYPVFIDRVIIWTVIPLCVLLGVGLAALSVRWRVVTLFMVAVLAMFVISGLVSSSRIPWMDIAAAIREQRLPGDAIVNCREQSHMQLVHYLDVGSDDFWTYHSGYDLLLDRSGIRYFNRDTARQIEGSQPNERERTLDIIRTNETIRPAEFPRRYRRAWVVMWGRANLSVHACAGGLPGEVVWSQEWRSRPSDFQDSVTGARIDRSAVALVELRCPGSDFLEP